VGKLGISVKFTEIFSMKIPSRNSLRENEFSFFLLKGYPSIKGLETPEIHNLTNSEKCEELQLGRKKAQNLFCVHPGVNFTNILRSAFLYESFA
jgi:hypothetical protein